MHSPPTSMRQTAAGSSLSGPAPRRIGSPPSGPLGLALGALPLGARRVGRWDDQGLPHQVRVTSFKLGTVELLHFTPLYDSAPGLLDSGAVPRPRRLFVCLFVCLSFCLSVCLFVFLFSFARRAPPGFVPLARHTAALH
jgi:hypothetical protein